MFYYWDAGAQHAAVFGDLADSFFFLFLFFIRSLLQAGRAFKSKSRVIPLPAKWETITHPKINKADVVLATHTTDTS